MQDEVQSKLCEYRAGTFPERSIILKWVTCLYFFLISIPNENKTLK